MVPPEGSAIVDALRVTNIAIKEKGFENATPSALRESGNDSKYAIAREAKYTDAYVRDVMRGLKSCKVSKSEPIPTILNTLMKLTLM